MNEVYLSGTVKKVIYRNEENAYTIFEVETEDGELCVCTGYVAHLAVGEHVDAEGDYVTHHQHGRQFAAEEISTIAPDGTENIKAYLESGSIKGIGKVLAERIVGEFGERSLDVIERAPEELSKIKGINPNKAKEFSKILSEQNGVKKIIAELSGLKIPPFIAVRLYKIFGLFAVEALRKNPYLLCSEEFDMGFEEVDNAALNVFGISTDSEIRITAGILYVLKHNNGLGHTFVPKESLISVAQGFLEVDEVLLYECYDKAILDEKIVCENVADLEAVFLERFHTAENYIAMKLMQMCSFEKKPRKLDKLLEQIENSADIEYAELQRRAILQSAMHGFFVLTGGPGTGKTTTLNGIIKMLEMLGEEVELIAPTGRAAKRMSELTGMSARTVHRFLGIEMKGPVSTFKYNEKNLSEADVVIVDEASMLEIMLFEALLRALKPSARLILVGDMSQLPPVGAGNVLKDVLGSDLFASVELTEIFRQARDSLIVVNAHRINKGEYPEFNDRDNDFFLVKHADKLTAPQLIAELAGKRLVKAYNLSATEDIQVITPTRKGEVGTVMLNNVLQDALNPAHKDKKQHKYRDLIFRVGDKVMQIKNNYELEFVVMSTGELSTGVFNGDIGKIIDVDYNGEFMTIMFDERQVEYPFDNLHQLDLAYAITVHKSQGSEYPAVLFASFKGAVRLQTRNLFYTAVTRARQIFVGVGDYGVMCQMCDNNKEDKRFSALKYMLLASIK